MTDIPALRPPHESPTIDTVYELTQRWRALMGSLGFSHHRLWLLLLDPDGRVVPHVVQIDDIPPGAEAADCVPLLEMAGHIVPEAGSLAILLSRAGSNPITTDDRSWARGLTEAADGQGIRLWPVHFANDVELRAFARDDLIG